MGCKKDFGRGRWLLIPQERISLRHLAVLAPLKLLCEDGIKRAKKLNGRELGDRIWDQLPAKKWRRKKMGRFQEGGKRPQRG
jgi:hypothetical protein